MEIEGKIITFDWLHKTFEGNQFVNLFNDFFLIPSLNILNSLYGR